MKENKPETIAKKDVMDIRRRYEESPTRKTIKELSKKYGVSQGRIQWYLKELADPIREKNRKLKLESIERDREKRQQKRWDKKLSKQYGKQELPDKTVVWFRLIPVDPDTLKREGGKITEENYAKIIKMGNHLQNANTIRIENVVKRQSHDSKWISKFAKKHGYPVKLLDTYSRAREPSRLSSSVRGTKSSNDFVIQVSGKSSKGGLTAGSGRVKVINEKPFLFIGADVVFEIYAKDDNPKDEYYIELKKRINNGESWSVTILDQRKWGNGFQAIFPHTRKVPVFNYSGKFYILIRPEVRLMRGYYNVYIFVGEEQVKHLNFSFPFGKIKNQDPKTREGIIRAFLQKSIKELWIKIKAYSQYQPCIIYINKVDDGTNREVSNWLSEGKMYSKLIDKLAWVQGEMIKVDVGNPQDLNTCLTRLSI